MTCHDIGEGEAAFADMRGDKVGEVALAEVDMEVSRGWYRDDHSHDQVS